MKITHFHVLAPHELVSRSNGSALQQIARELCESARRAGDRAFIVCGEHDGRDTTISLPLLEPVRPARRRLDPILSRVFGMQPTPPDRLALSEIQPDVVWLHNRPWDADRFRKQYPNALVVLYVHNRILRWYRPPTMRALLKKFDAIICVSRFIADDLVERARHLPKDPAVVHSAAPGAATAPIGTDTKPHSDLLYVGRLNKAKGVIDLLRAARRVPGASLTIVGGAWFTNQGKLSRFERRAHRLGAMHDPPVTFTGPLAPAEVEAWRAASSITVVPSRWHEPLGLTVLEAMRSDAAVIATRSGGIPELAASGGALLVRRGRPRDLARAIIRLMHDEAFRAQNAQMGKRVTAERTWDVVHTDLMATLDLIGLR